jgi:flagellar motor protein MotB
MRRRNSINVWPAFADLMTVLAVVGLFTTIAISRVAAQKVDLTVRLRQLQQARQEMKEKLKRLDQERKVREQEWNQERAGLQKQTQEAARNQEMFRAIQEVQRFIDEISRNSGLLFGTDQSLQFGDNLVSFKVNSTDPIWQADSRERLRKFCEAVSRQGSYSLGSASIRDLFVIEVEGHTDSTNCRGEPSCNWQISSGRAAEFVSFMRRDEYCPGGAAWNLRPIGYADTKPPVGGKVPTRRIAVRLAPNYESLINRGIAPRR